MNLLNDSNLGWSLEKRNPESLKILMPFLGWLYQYYFRVESDGWHHIPDEGALFVGSHNGGLAAPDLYMFIYDWLRRYSYERSIYILSHQINWKIWSKCPRLAKFAAECGAVRAASKPAIAALRQGASVLVYPGGAQDVFRPHKFRGKIHFSGRIGFITLALRESVPIIPLISWGAHDTLIVLGDYYRQIKFLNKKGIPWPFGVDPEIFPIYLGLPWGISVGPLPNIPFPTKIYIRVCPPIYLKQYGREMIKDKKYVEECAFFVKSRMQEELNKLKLEVTGET